VTSDPVAEPGRQTSSLSLDELVTAAISNHPKVQAAQAQISAAQNRVILARALPDPMAETMFWPIQGNAQQLASGRMQNQLSFSQTVPWPDKLQTQAQVACQEVRMARAELRDIENEIAESVRMAYFEIWFAHRATKIVTENRQLALDIVKVAEARYAAGGSQQDVLRAEVEVQKLEKELLELAKESEIAQAELATLVRQPTDFVVEVAQDLPVIDVPKQLELLLTEAERCNPQLQELAWQIQRDIEKQRLADLQRYPDITYGFQYGWMTRDAALDPVADGIDNISFSVGTTLPFWKRKIQAGVCEASADRLRSIQLHDAEWNSIAGRLRRLVQEAQALDQQRTLFEERIIPRAVQALEVAQADYTVGKTTFVQLVENFTEVLTFRVQLARLDASLSSVMAQLQRTVGCEN